MSQSNRALRVLYSFPHRLGAGRICYTAWQQVNGLAAAGADVLVHPASLERPVPPEVSVYPTLSRGRMRIPYRLLGDARAFSLHDFIVAKRLERLAGRVDIVHTWPQGALRTLETAARLGIPSVLERANAHTRFAYEVVRNESQRLGVELPRDHEHAFNEDILRVEEAEFDRADRLLCPSDFVVETFVTRGFTRDRLPRHFYGFDEKTYYPGPELDERPRGLNMLFVGVCAVRKGLHFALEAWLNSQAHETGTFQIAGEFLPSYKAKLEPMLRHTSVKILGHRTDVPELMRRSDVLVLPSIEEGSALVCTEAIGSGCVPLVSDACTDICRHLENALIHHVGDVPALTEHISWLHRDRALLMKLRRAGSDGLLDRTWTAAGRKLLDVYRETIEMHGHARRALTGATH